jgi:hypothetical protein
MYRRYRTRMHQVIAVDPIHAVLPACASSV